MTLQEWAREITIELEASGYTVTLTKWDFPLVQTPKTLGGKMHLLEWSSPTRLPCAKIIYADGMLIVPGTIA